MVVLAGGVVLEWLETSNAMTAVVVVIVVGVVVVTDPAVGVHAPVQFDRFHSV